jgi:hypothetical protein
MIRRPRGLRTAGLVAVVALAGLLDTACQHPAPLAPSGATIILSSPVATLPLNGTTEIVAQVNGSVRTPPQRGTLVSFATTLGAVEPAQAETDNNGRVSVRFRAGNASGTATITAASGEAGVDEGGVIRIAVGAAAVGRVVISTDAALASSGGGVKIVVLVVDINGAPMRDVTVTLATTSGSLSQNVVVTNGNGRAEVILTTPLPATITAIAGTQSATANVTFVTRPQPSVTIGLFDTANDPRVNGTTTFTITAAPTPSNTIVATVVSFGDGTSLTLAGAAASVQHVYTATGTYVVTVTVTDSSGESGAASTVINVR